MEPANSKQHLPLTAAVLAGGRSLRMGVDKTLLTVDGEPLVRHVVEVVSGVCERAIVVTNRPESLADVDLPEGVAVVTDEIPYQGPLGGLATALASTDHEWVLAVAADMPWLQAGIVRALWAARDGADAVVPATESGLEPLLALYRVEPCLPAVRAALESGRRRVVGFFPQVNVRQIPAEELRGADPGLLSLVNVNTPDDLAEVRAAASDLGNEGDPSPGHRHSHEVRLQVVEVGTRRARGMPSERPITLYMNDVEIATVQASPEDLEEMAAGFLLSEGLMSDRDALQGIDADAKRGMVYVRTTEAVPDDMVHKTRYITSGCGKGVTFSTIGHARNLAHIESDVCIDSETLYAMMGSMARAAEHYRDSGGAHACALGRDGEVVLVREDVGRHNALDKLLGRAWLDRIPTGDAVLLTTGRISYEMAVKAAKSRVPVVVSRTAVTDLAAEIAAELGITVVGYARGGKLVVYTHPARVCIAEENA